MRTPSPLAVQLLPDSHCDRRELAELGVRLRGQLLDAGVDSVDPIAGGPAPAGTKAAEWVVLGGFLVEAGRSVPMLRRVLGALRDWVTQQPVRSVKVTLDGDTIEITNPAGDDQRRLIEVWISRHAES